MADKSLITQEQLQSDFEDFYSQKIYPYLNGATHAGFTPVGSVIAIMGNEAPNHYLVCDGTLYTIADYPQLTAYFEDQFGSVNYFGGNGTTTFAVPDLRGEFLRGTGTNSHTDQGNGANVGTHQDGTKIPYFQLENYTTPKMSFLALDSNHQTSYISNTDKIIKGDTTRIDITGSSGTTPEPYNSQSYTSRPTNTSVLWCIAYENTYIDGSGQSSGGGHKIQNEGDLEPLTQRKTMLLNEPLVASDDAEGGNTVIDVDSDVDLSVIHAPGVRTPDEFEVVITDPQEGQVMKYNATNEQWENGEIDTKHTYSTDEKVIGTWIDGSLIYEKVVFYETAISVTSSWTDTEISNSNIGIIIDLKCYIDLNNNSVGRFCVASKDVNSTTVKIKSLSSLAETVNRIIFSYTKTTDTSQS